MIQLSNALTGVSKNIDRQNRHFFEKDERTQKNRLAKKLGAMKRVLSFQINRCEIQKRAHYLTLSYFMLDN